MFLKTWQTILGTVNTYKMIVAKQIKLPNHVRASLKEQLWNFLFFF